MTSAELEKALEHTGTCIIPTASIEVMGGHGPLGADMLVADTAAPELAVRAECLSAPTVPYGDAMELQGWPGTMSVRREILTELYLDIARSLVDHGFRKPFFLNIHSLNKAAIDGCCRILASKGVDAASGEWWKTAFSVAGDIVEDTVAPYGHGGEVITSVLLAIEPDCVRLERADNEKPKADAE